MVCGGVNLLKYLLTYTASHPTRPGISAELLCVSRFQEIYVRKAAGRKASVVGQFSDAIYCRNMDGHSIVHLRRLSSINVGAQTVGSMSLQAGAKRGWPVHSSSSTIVTWCLLFARYILILDFQHCFQI